MDAHRHHWSVVDLYVDDDSPMMRQACACRAVRAIRAWDRSWDPAADPAPSGRELAMPNRSGERGHESPP